MSKNTSLQTQEVKDFFSFKRTYSTGELDSLKKNVIDNIISPYIDFWKIIPAGLGLLEQEAAGWDDRAKAYGFKKKISTLNDIEEYVLWWLDFYHQIKTKEDFDEQYSRIEKTLYFGDLKLPIIVKFDYQIKSIDAIKLTRPPTFYSFLNDQILTDRGKGAFVIAFPACVKMLTDEELMVAVKHEFGHIVQGHCAIRAMTAFEQEYNNKAMDISINIGFTPQEKKLLMKLAVKLWGKGATPCMSLIGPETMGGFGIRRYIEPGAWVEALTTLRIYLPPKQGQEGGQGQQGQNSDGDGQSNNQIEEINVGDYVIVRGSSPKTYGQVTGIDPTTGKAQIKEFTDEEWKEIKKTLQ